MARLTIQVRTQDSLLDLLARGESPAWIVAKDKQERITHVQIVNWDGTQLIEGVFDRQASTRDDARDQKRLTLRFLDGRIKNCRIEFTSQQPVRYLEE